MPSPQDALSYAKRYVGRLPVDDAEIKYRLLDDAHKKLWMAAPWRWTVGYLDVVTIQNDQQDYAVTPVGDFVHLLHSIFTNGQEKRDLAVSAALPAADKLKGRPSQVSFSSNVLRFLPVPTGYPVANLPVVITAYKKTADTIGAGNIASDYSTFGIPPEWFWVYQEIVLAKAYQFSHDPRLGGVTFTPGGVQYTGQLGVVEAAIADMRRSEEKFLNSLGMEVTEGV